MYKISTVVSVIILLITATVLVASNYDMNSEVDLGPGIRIIQDNHQIKQADPSSSVNDSEPSLGTPETANPETGISSSDANESSNSLPANTKSNIRITKFFPHITGGEHE